MRPTGKGKTQPRPAAHCSGATNAVNSSPGEKHACESGLVFLHVSWAQIGFDTGTPSRTCHGSRPFDPPALLQESVAMSLWSRFTLTRLLDKSPSTRHFRPALHS